MWERGYIPRRRSVELPWLGAAAAGADFGAGTVVRMLSVDPADGACTCLWRVPAGWHRDEPTCLPGAEALYVLAGELDIARRRHRAGHYLFHPAGAAKGPLRSDSGALLLAMWDARPGSGAPEEVRHVVGDAGPVVSIDTRSMEGRPTPVPGPVAGILVKILRVDAATGGMTMLVTIPPGWTEPRSEHHDCIEESYKLDGAIDLEENGVAHTLEAGDYFFRPPRIKHGPMRTIGGTTSLIRFSAPVVNHYGPL